MTTTNASYNEAVKYASYKEVSRQVAKNRGDNEAAYIAELELRGMAKIISTLYGTWDDDDYSRTYEDIINAANEYMGK